MAEYQYTASGGVIVNGEQVLVLLRPSRNEVRLPKGHIEEGDTPEKAALREVMEETGYSGLEIIGNLGKQTVEFDYDGRHIIRTEFFFLMKTRNAELGPTSQGEEQFKPAWCDFIEAIETLSFEAEKEWVRRALDYIRGKEKK